MDKVTSFEQYKEVIAKAKQSGFQLTNCFFLAAETREKIEKGSLFFHVIENGLLLLDDLGDFYRCYYYLSGDKRPSKVRLSKNAVIELPFTGELADRQREQVRIINLMGFKLGRESGLMSLPSEKILDVNDRKAPVQSSFAMRGDAAQIYALLYQTFDPLYAFLPSMAELENSIDHKMIFTIHDGEKVSAFLNSRFEKRTAFINHIVVDRQFRGRGYGELLIKAYHEKYHRDVATFQHWVDLDNHAAINMYRKFGYKFSLRKANEYILMMEE